METRWRKSQTLDPDQSRVTEIHADYRTREHACPLCLNTSVPFAFPPTTQGLRWNGGTESRPPQNRPQEEFQGTLKTTVATKTINLEEF